MSSRKSQLKATVETISDPLAATLATLQQRWIPTTATPCAIQELQYGQRHISILGGTLRVCADAAELHCQLPYRDGLGFDLFPGLWNHPLKALTVDGAAFDAQQAIETNTSIDGVRRHAQTTLKAFQWQLIGKTKPSYWVGRLNRALPASPGNLLLRGAQVNDVVGLPWFSRGHFRFQGAQHTYYLLATQERQQPILVIDPQQSPLSLKAVNLELQALSFCFGQPYACPLLVGVDPSCCSVAFAGSEFGFATLNKNRIAPPVPLDFMDIWPVTLFETLVPVLDDPSRSEQLLTAIWFFMESLSEIWVSSYESKALQAVLAAARLHLPEPPNRAQLHGSPLALVTSALQCAGLPENSDLLTAVSEASDALFGVSVPGFAPTATFDDSRCERLRTLATGLICTAVGYRGPIVGWEDRTANAASTGWWTRDDAVDLPKRWTAETEQEPSQRVTHLWPRFSRPRLPSSLLIDVVAKFAEGLGSRTGGVVSARLMPVPGMAEDELPLFDFRILVTKTPNINMVLFSLEYDAREEQVRVIGWDAESPLISDGSEMSRFLKEVAQSPETYRSVQRLLLATPEEQP